MAEDRFLHIRQLKGASLAVLLLMMQSDQPLQKSWLAQATGYSDKPIHAACEHLKELGLLDCQGRKWFLIPGIKIVFDQRNSSELAGCPDDSRPESLPARQVQNNQKTSSSEATAKPFEETRRKSDLLPESRKNSEFQSRTATVESWFGRLSFASNESQPPLRTQFRSSQNIFVSLRRNSGPISISISINAVKVLKDFKDINTNTRTGISPGTQKRKFTIFRLIPTEIFPSATLLPRVMRICADGPPVSTRFAWVWKLALPKKDGWRCFENRDSHQPHEWQAIKYPSGCSPSGSCQEKTFWKKDVSACQKTQTIGRTLGYEN